MSRRPGLDRSALAALTVWHLQVAETAAALPDRSPVADVRALLGPGVPAGAVEDALPALARAGLVVVEHGQARHGRALDEIFPAPLGLPPRAAEVLAESTVAGLQEIAKHVGARPAGRKAEVLAAVTAALVDSERVRRAAARVPARLADGLRAAVAGTDDGADEDVFDLDRYRAQQSLTEWLVSHGLAVRLPWRQVVVPREVVLVLRGPDWHPDSTPTAPDVPTRSVDAEQVDRQAAASAVAAADLVDELLAACQSGPPALLASGGIGVREIRRLAKALSRDEQEVTLALEVAGAAHLLAEDAGVARPTGHWPAWRRQPAAERWCTLVETWWDLAYAPGVPQGAAGKPLPPLALVLPPGLPRDDVRERLLARLAGTPRTSGVVGPARLAERMVWEAPLTFAGDPAGGVASAWAGAAWLGLLAAGALASTGRALSDGGVPGLLEVARTVLPAPTEQATFQADLTAVVAGAPSASLRDLLDGAADVESRGAATVWRFGAGSVRRAFDAGRTAGDLLGALRRAAGRDLPQPLTYLVGDVARQHGRVRVSAVAACLVVDDAALGQELAAHRGLRALALRTVAPTVLVSPRPHEEVLTALRAAGYAPATDAAGPATVTRAAPTKPEPATGHRSAPARRPRTTPAPSAPPRAPAPRTAPARPARAVDPDPAVPGLVPGDGLARMLPRLVPVEVRVLTRALDEDEAVQIQYVDGSGRRTTRVVSELVLEPPFLLGWCHLREDERQFALARIEAVRPVPA